MFTPTSGISLDRVDVKRLEYALVRVHTDDSEDVRLGVKIVMGDGKRYGNMIQIPLSRLKELITAVDTIVEMGV